MGCDCFQRVVGGLEARVRLKECMSDRSRNIDNVCSVVIDMRYCVLVTCVPSHG